MRLASTARTVSFFVKQAHCISDYHKTKQLLLPNMRTAHLNIFKNVLPQLKNLNVSVFGTFHERSAQTCMHYVANQSSVRHFNKAYIHISASHSFTSFASGLDHHCAIFAVWNLPCVLACVLDIVFHWLHDLHLRGTNHQCQYRMDWIVWSHIRGWSQMSCQKCLIL